VKFSAALALVAVLGVAACSSTPSAKAVAEDYIESIPNLTDGQRQCMLEKLDTYSDETLTSIGDANLDVDFDDQSAAATQTTPEFREFVDDLAECMSSSEG
jgi:hypothetical protein